MKSQQLSICLLVLLCVPAFAAYDNCSSGDIIYVDDDFGGFQTGSATNPYISINYAIGRADSTGKSCVWVKQGTYNEDIDMISGISVYGGFKEDDWNTRDPDSYASLITGSSASSMVTLDNDDNLEFDGFSISMRSGAYIAISAENGSHGIVIANNTIEKNNSQSDKNAIELWSSSGLIESNRIYATSSSNEWEKGIALYSSSTYKWFIQYNSIEDCSAHGIVASMTDYEGSISNNEVTNCGTGIVSSWSTAVPVHVKNNEIVDCDTGITTGLFNGTYVTGNTIEGFTTYGISLQGGNGNINNKVFQNKLLSAEDASSIGINIASSATVETVDFNWIGDCDTGILVNHSGTIKENGIWSCDTAIEVTHSSGDVYLWNNSIKNPGSYGILRTTTQDTDIRNNILYSNGSATGISVTSTTGLTNNYNDVDNFSTEYSGCSAGANSISADPRWVAPPFDWQWASDWLFFLRQSPCQSAPYSPCVNAGDPSFTPFGTTKSNLDDDIGIIDQGAHIPILDEAKEASYKRAFFVDNSVDSGLNDEDIFDIKTQRDARSILKAVAEQLRDPESEYYGKEETILIWFADREFPWLVTVEAEAFR